MLAILDRLINYYNNSINLGPESFNLDLEAKDNVSRTAYELAKSEGNYLIIDIFNRKMSRLMKNP